MKYFKLISQENIKINSQAVSFIQSLLDMIVKLFFSNILIYEKFTEEKELDILFRKLFSLNKYNEISGILKWVFKIQSEKSTPHFFFGEIIKKIILKNENVSLNVYLFAKTVITYL